MSQNIVETEYGPVKGLQTKIISGEECFSFRGIPYMKPPLGTSRFREAEPPAVWYEALDVTQEGPSYFMTDFMTGIQDGQENAGTINVFTRSTKPEKLRPVMIWVHGGGFGRGSSRTDLYGPDYLLEKDVVFVSFNYRLGAIGFLSLSDPSLQIPGNVGLKDQIFALKWIQRNIEKFGGDPRNCTIFGESAGGSSVHYLCITQQTRDLFHRAIIISGSSLNKTWALIPRSNQAERLARFLGWKGKGGDEREILSFLETVSAFELDNGAKALMTDEDQFGYGMIIPFGPVIEPYVTENCVVTKEPVEMARETWTNNIDMIVMGTSFEGILRAGVGEEKVVEFMENPSYFAPLAELGLDPDDEKAIELGTRIKNLYFSENEKVSLENQEKYLKYTSDLHFWHGLHRVVKSRKEHGTAKTYLIRFAVDADLNMFKKFVKKCEKYSGACHADDLFYIFATDYHEPPSTDSKEFATIKKLVGIFTSFAISNDPNCSELSDLKIIPNADETMCVNVTENDVTVVKLPEASKLKVWDSVYEEANVPLY